jgi:hypothetical protein
MPTHLTPLQRCNGILRAFGVPFWLREHRRSQWVTVYEVLPGRRTRERSLPGTAVNDGSALEAVVATITPEDHPRTSAVAQPCWPEICAAVVAFQRGQGVNMNLVGPFRGQGHFCLLPADRAATVEDVRRFALHKSESLRAHLADESEPLLLMATHRQGSRQKREVVSLLRRAGFGAIAPESLSEELKGLVNRKKQALVEAGQSRRRIPSTAAIEEWLDAVMVEDPLWGWVFAMIATYGLRPHEVWRIDGLPEGNGLITVGVAARHIKVTKTGFRAAVPLPAAWAERYGLGGVKGKECGAADGQLSAELVEATGDGSGDRRRLRTPHPRSRAGRASHPRAVDPSRG